MNRNRMYILMLVSLLLPFFVQPLHEMMLGWATDIKLDERIAMVKARSNDTYRVLIKTRPSAGSAPLAGIADAQDFGLNTGPSATAEQVEAVLAQYNSPAAGKGLGDLTVEESKRTGIDNAYWLFQFVWESGAGSNPKWAGNKGGGHYTANTGNVIAANGYGTYGNFADFNDDWEAGVKAHFDLMVEYRDTANYGNPPHQHTSIRDLIATWAPTEDGNDPGKYADFVEAETRTLRNINGGKAVAQGNAGPVQIHEAVAIAPAEHYEAPALALDGCLGTNVRSAHNSSPGLHDVRIPAGQSWSFDANWVINGDGQGVDCGVYYGGVCNQASRWSNVARHLGLPVQSVYHGKIYDSAVDKDDNISIWSDGQWGGVGGQDVVINNTTNRTVHITATIEGNNYTVKGWFE